ncbi:MAG: response regulator, partial [Prevotella sp.]|nr:response regulator [Prevotella sp.]
NTVSDDTAESAINAIVPKDIVQEGHLEMLNQEDADELPNILIVEDNGDMRRYLRTLLANRFYVLEASDGQNGLKLARESVPDLIISDVMMPVMDGLQLCKHLKEDFITSHIPVILLTARSEEHQQMEGYESGADAYLTKPFSATLLISRIDNLLATRRQLRQLFDTNKQVKVPDDVKLTTQDSLFIDQLKETISSNMANPNLKMDDLGEQLGISRVQLYRKVKTLTGLSPVELLRQMRLQKGKILLNTTTKTVAEIAYEVGFNSASYFANCFKKQFGKLPMELRE